MEITEILPISAKIGRVFDFNSKAYSLLGYL
jgi:hypothetical protein